MKRSAFTLIELLVVVAIIVALLAILMPSLNKAIDASHLAVCGSQQHQISSSLLAYAADDYGQLPESNASAWPIYGAGATWFSLTNLQWPSYLARGEGQPMGVAFLVMNGYFDAVEALYCPAWTHPYHQFDTVDSAGLDPAGNVPNKFGGWPDEPNPGPTTFRGISYIYRASIGLDPNDDTMNLTGGRAPRLNRDGSIPILSDHFTERFVEWDDYTHPAGFMVLNLGGSVEFKADPNDHEYISSELGAFSHERWGAQERVWLEFF